MPYENLYLAEDSDQYPMVYTPQPGTPSPRQPQTPRQLGPRRHRYPDGR
jgi:hypothetical protein